MKDREEGTEEHITNGSGCNQRGKWKEKHGQEQNERKEKRNKKVRKEKRKEKESKEGRERWGGLDKMKHIEGDMERDKN